MNHRECASLTRNFSYPLSAPLKISLSTWQSLQNVNSYLQKATVSVPWVSYLCPKPQPSCDHLVVLLSHLINAEIKESVLRKEFHTSCSCPFPACLFHSKRNFIRKVCNYIVATMQPHSGQSMGPLVPELGLAPPIFGDAGSIHPSSQWSDLLSDMSQKVLESIKDKQSKLHRILTLRSMFFSRSSHLFIHESWV